jgi:DNA-binding transcriptional regulator/RsmH inhibitor MraZ
LSIPQALRDYASLNSSTLMVGLLTHAELWNSERWSQVSAALESNAEAVAERLALGSNREAVE